MRFKVRAGMAWGFVLFLVTVLAACSGPSPEVSLTLSSSSATVLRGQSVSVDVTLVRSGGASADVSLSADVPTYPDVKATFTPPTLTGSILTSTLTIDVDTDADDGPITILVSADGSGVAASQEFTLTVDSVTVTGLVVGLFDTPLAGVSVSSQGVDAVTAADGSFVLAGLSVPYDVTVYSTADQWVHVFEGMVVPSPVLMPYAAAMGGPALARTADLSGTLTGATVPVAAGHVLVVCAEGVSVAVYAGCDRLVPGDSTYSVSVGWHGASSVPVRVHALEVATDIDGQPTAYGGYGMVEATLTDAGVLTKDVALGAGPASTTFSGAATAASGVVLSLGYVSLRFSDNLSVGIAAFDPTVPFSLLMPSLPNATFDAFAGGSAGSGQSIAWTVGSTGSAGTLMVGAPPVLVSPPPGSTDVTVATQFKAANDAGGILTFTWNATGSGPSFSVTTASGTASIPDVAGIALPPAADYQMGLLGATGYETVDAGSHAYLQDFYSLLFLLGAGGPGPAVNGGVVVGSGVPFTTAP